MNTLKQRKDLIIGVVLALIVGLLLGYGWGRQNSGAGGIVMSPKLEATTSTKTMSGDAQLLGSKSVPSTAVVAEGDSVSVVTQPAGTNVRVRFVMLSQEGWVAIRNAQGITLGAALFAPGDHTNVSVPLLKSTVAGQNYQALIYFDDGTKTFNLKTETIVLNPDGSVAGTTFNTH